MAKRTKDEVDKVKKELEQQSMEEIFKLNTKKKPEESEKKMTALELWGKPKKQKK